jgi:glycosyltransferase involved in cell wall biosynthesis
MFGIDVKSLRRKKIVFSAENLYPHDSKQVTADIAYTQKILNYTDGVIFTSEAAREVYEGVYKLPTGAVRAVVPHIHYIEQYPDQVTREEARRHLSLPSGKKVILSLGRMHPYKGLTHLIQSFCRVATADDCLVIAGRAKSVQVVEQLRQVVHTAKGAGTVELIDRFIPDEELQYFYNASDAVAIPYDDMPINPGSVIMAMGFGKCIIAPDKGPIRELIHPEGLFTYADQQESGLATALRAFGGIDDPERRGRLNRQRALDRHAPEVAGKKFNALYQSIL